MMKRAPKPTDFLRGEEIRGSRVTGKEKGFWEMGEPWALQLGLSP